MRWRLNYIKMAALNPHEIVQLALRARDEYGICERAQFGDCKDTSQGLVNLLQERGLHARVTGSQFIYGYDNNPAYEGDDEEASPHSSNDHSWVMLNGWILDPTVDQFFSDMDVDLVTKTPGVYFSHPQWDGPKYVNRYLG